MDSDHHRLVDFILAAGVFQREVPEGVWALDRDQLPVCVGLRHGGSLEPVQVIYEILFSGLSVRYYRNAAVCIFFWPWDYSAIFVCFFFKFVDD